MPYENYVNGKSRFESDHRAETTKSSLWRSKGDNGYDSGGTIGFITEHLRVPASYAE